DLAAGRRRDREARRGHRRGRRAPRGVEGHDRRAARLSKPAPMELGYARTDLRRRLVDAVLCGEKTATAGLLSDYGPDDQLAEPGDRPLPLGFADAPVALVELNHVRAPRRGDIAPQFARRCC